MGKYPKSELLDFYSDWHWQRCGKHCYMADCDLVLTTEGDSVERLWVEARDNGVVAIIDVKGKRDEVTYTEKIVYNDIVKNWKRPVYIVYANAPYEVEKHGEDNEKHFKGFRVVRWEDKKEKKFTEDAYIKWIEQLKKR